MLSKLKFAEAYGFRNIQTIVRNMKTNRCPYLMIEIMACPSGCLNGGGQIRSKDEQTLPPKDFLRQVEEAYCTFPGEEIDPQANRIILDLYRTWICGDHFSQTLSLRTSYKAVEKMEFSVNLEW